MKNVTKQSQAVDSLGAVPTLAECYDASKASVAGDLAQDGKWKQAGLKYAAHFGNTQAIEAMKAEIIANGIVPAMPTHFISALAAPRSNTKEGKAFYAELDKARADEIKATRKLATDTSQVYFSRIVQYAQAVLSPSQPKAKKDKTDKSDKVVEEQETAEVNMTIEQFRKYSANQLSIINSKARELDTPDFDVVEFTKHVSAAMQLLAESKSTD